MTPVAGEGGRQEPGCRVSVDHGQVRRLLVFEMKVIVKLSRNLDSWQLCTDGHTEAEAAFIPPL